MCNWAPERGYRYNYYISDTVRIEDGSAGCDESNAGLTAATQSNSDPAANMRGGFTAGAAANIDSDLDCDGWNINDANDLWSTQDDVY